MKHLATHRRFGFFTLVVLILGTPLFAAETAGAAGDWLIKVDFDGRQMESLLIISKDAAGQYTGQTVGFWGINPLLDVKIEGDSLSYKQVFRFGGEESTSVFKGTLTGDKLTGTTSGDRGDFDLTGEKIKPLPPVVGSWEFIRRRNDRETKSVLTVKADKEGKLSADWTSQRGESKITDLNYADGKLTFKRTAGNEDRQFTMEYEMTVDGDELEGTVNTPRGTREIEGELIGDDLIGRWELSWETDRGPRKQLLIVYPDMSARFGSELIEKIDFEDLDDADGKVHFKLTRTFGDRTFETELTATVDEDDMSGRLVTNWGAEDVTGKKIAGMDDDEDDDDDDDDDDGDDD